MKNKLILSPLDHTWIIDLDGSIVKHNGYSFGKDELFPEVKEFFDKLPKDDYVIILTSRKEEVKDMTIKFLEDNNIRFNQIIFNLPYGERILINDMKESGLTTAYSVNLKRNKFDVSFEIDETK